MSTADDLQWMQRALALAIRGQGFVEPNPMVGAVVLDAVGQPVGEGFHAKFGGPHAEVVAFAAAGEKARGGTLFVTLEPCCHHGKTPPCTDAILAAGVKRVVAAMTDPFPKVAGGGIAQLAKAGIEVEVGLCEADARYLNAPFLKRITTGKPWVHLKWAMSLDGKTYTQSGHSQWISSVESRRLVHELRGRVDAILAGGGTVRTDDPLLTARPPGARVAIRIVLSASGNLPVDCQLLATVDEAPVLILTTTEGAKNLTVWQDAGAEVWVPEPHHRGREPLECLLYELGSRGVTNLMVEGGAVVQGAFLDAGEVDEVHAFVAPILVGGYGGSAAVGKGVDRIPDALRLVQFDMTPSGVDVYLHGRVMRSDTGS
jgi:diaminohydroxyphosphoribosylaminopyrimidine deaminase/5-amino-6-(5-phosphoribosylamino)uracil reductase